MPDPIDDTNWTILQALQDDARLSYAELGKRVGLTPPAVAERVHRLEEAGIITGYHAAVSLPAVGLPIAAVILLTVTQGRCREVGARLSEMPEVQSCRHVTGSICFVIEVAVTSMAHLAAFIDRISRHGQTTTCVVLSSPVERRTVDHRAVCGPAEPET